MDHTAIALEVIDNKIDALQRQIEGLLMARHAIGGQPAPAPMPLLAAPTKAPAQTSRKASKAKLPDDIADTSTLEPDFNINGVDVFLTVEERRVWNVLNAAEENQLVPIAEIETETGKEKTTIYAVLNALKKKLLPANATIEKERGVGYRIVDIASPRAPKPLPGSRP